MPRNLINPQFPTSAGTPLTYEAADAAGAKFYNSGRQIFRVKNGGGSSINVVLQTPQTIDGIAVPDKTVAVAAGTEAPFCLRPQDYNRLPGTTDEGTVYVDFSGVTSVTVALEQPSY